MKQFNKTDEEMYSQMGKNTVSSRKQLEETKVVRFINLGGKGRRIMFVGNSITLHGILPSIGWHNEWGMAASAKENDYVHLLVKKISEVTPDPSFCICQVAEWERDYKNGETKHCLFENARDYDADIIVTRFIENCSLENFDSDIFKKSLNSLLNYLDKSNNAKIVLTTGFWKHPGDKAIMEYAKEKGWPCVWMGDLGEQDDMKAIGLFEHSGVANHPGDLGMKNIAERIFSELRKIM